MHELSVCQALLIQVTEIVQTRGAAAVNGITIEVGPLSGTEPDLLLNAFLVMRSGVTAAADLVIERSVVVVNCLECDARSEAQPNRLLCTHCGGWCIQVIGGNELRLLRVELSMPATAARRDLYPNAEQAAHV